MRKLASVQKIEKVFPIEGADAIEAVQILGWTCVTKKNEFKAGDLCVYIEIDSMLPTDNPCFSFLDKDKGREYYRLKTCRLRGQLSQGIVFKIDDLLPSELDIDSDVTDWLGIKKFEPKVTFNNGIARSTRPTFIPKTDEVRVQSILKIVENLKGKKYVATMKLDGTSSSYFFNDSEFGVCSRKQLLDEGADDVYWKMAHKYDIENVLRKHFENTGGQEICIQGETCGPSIQKNRLGLKEIDFFVFDIYDIKTGKYLDHPDVVSICEEFNLKIVPIIEAGDNFNYTLEELLDKANNLMYDSVDEFSDSNWPAEGIVFRSVVEETGHKGSAHGRMSFKVISNKFLLKGGE